MAEEHLSYERIRALVAKLPPSRSADERSIRWLDDGQVLGVARNEHERLEVFLSGPALLCRSRVVAAALDHRAWARRDDGQLLASRLLLPAEPHFDAVAAFLAAHLLDAGFLSERQSAFSRSEPVIALALDAAGLGSGPLLGLLGELLCLMTMLEVAPDRAQQLINCWDGNVMASRDFQLGAIGLEVKTTAGRESTHNVSGIRQTEVGHGNDGADESHLFLQSIGLERVPVEELDPSDHTLPRLVDRILSALDRALTGMHERGPVRESFLKKLASYGDDVMSAYDHFDMQHRLLYQQPWRITFARCYDMSAEGIQLPRSADLVGFGHLDLDSVSFRMRLPSTIRGDLNPRVGLRQALGEVLAAAWPAAS